ncbi:hypothetical protein GF343_02720 [Candidatus Woesearchaeota archaeon]|nr:hypothetical protein [Candidatus Woesearchaeota archaeon]
MYNLYEILFKEYGPQGWWPVNGKYSKNDFSIPRNKKEKFEIIVGAVLTQNTSWKNAEKAIANLRKANILDPVKIVKADKKVLAQAIRPSGYFNQKAGRLKLISDFLLKNKDISRLPVEDMRNKLLGIKGVGPETADSILLYAYNKPSFVVDLYTKRIFSRIGICKNTAKYGELQGLLHKKLKKDAVLFNEYHALIVEHAKRFCKKVPECSGCPLGKLCKKRI